VKEFAFEVGLIARVRVRAPDEASARRAVPSVIGAPGAQDIALANQGIDVLLPGVMVTAVDFIPDTKVKLGRARKRPPSSHPPVPGEPKTSCVAGPSHGHPRSHHKRRVLGGVFRGVQNRPQGITPGRKENPYENNAAGPLCGYMGCAVSGRARDESLRHRITWRGGRRCVG
jgi:hypothetical protein